MTTLPGAAMNIAPELLVQEALVNGLAALGQDRRAVDELVARTDELRNGTADEWRTALRNALLEMVDPRSDMFADVLLSYPVPLGKARLPCVSIVPQSGGENPSEAVAGDLLRQSTELVGPNTEAWETTEIGSGQRTTLQIGVWTAAPERTAVLYAAVKWALYRTKQELMRKGIHELTYTEGGVEPNHDLEPRVAYVPMLSLTLNWTFRASYRQKVPNRVRFLPGSYST